MVEGGWVEGERGERTPFEASLLSSLDHPGKTYLRILADQSMISSLFVIIQHTSVRTIPSHYLGIVKVLDVFQNPTYVQVATYFRKIKTYFYHLFKQLLLSDGDGKTWRHGPVRVH